MEKLSNRSFTIRIEPEILEELERIAKAQKWTLSFTIREMLGEYVPYRDKAKDLLPALVEAYGKENANA